jgi:hypothetical protein
MGGKDPELKQALQKLHRSAESILDGISESEDYTESERKKLDHSLFGFAEVAAAIKSFDLKVREASRINAVVDKIAKLASKKRISSKATELQMLKAQSVSKTKAPGRTREPQYGQTLSEVARLELNEARRQTEPWGRELTETVSTMLSHAAEELVGKESSEVSSLVREKNTMFVGMVGKIATEYMAEASLSQDAGIIRAAGQSLQDQVLTITKEYTRILKRYSYKSSASNGLSSQDTEYLKHDLDIQINKLEDIITEPEPGEREFLLFSSLSEPHEARPRR